MYLKE